MQHLFINEVTLYLKNDSYFFIYFKFLIARILFQINVTTHYSFRYGKNVMVAIITTNSILTEPRLTVKYILLPVGTIQAKAYQVLADDDVQLKIPNPVHPAVRLIRYQYQHYVHRGYYPAHPSWRYSHSVHNDKH